MRVSEIRVKQIRVNQGLGVLANKVSVVVGIWYVTYLLITHPVRFEFQNYKLIKVLLNSVIIPYTSLLL